MALSPAFAPLRSRYVGRVAKGGYGELARIRREYESSLSWRLTRPLAAAGRLGRAMRSKEAPDPVSQPPIPDRIDSWLEHFYGDRLAALDAPCADGAEGQ